MSHCRKGRKTKPWARDQKRARSWSCRWTSGGEVRQVSSHGDSVPHQGFRERRFAHPHVMFKNSLLAGAKAGLGMAVSQGRLRAWTEHMVEQYVAPFGLDQLLLRQ